MRQCAGQEAATLWRQRGERRGCCPTSSHHHYLSAAWKTGGNRVPFPASGGKRACANADVHVDSPFSRGFNRSLLTATSSWSWATVSLELLRKGFQKTRECAHRKHGWEGGIALHSPHPPHLWPQPELARGGNESRPTN